MKRIVYLSADVAKPAGGVRTMFQHVASLRAMGWDAVVAQAQARTPDWFEHAVPVISDFDTGDVAVVPEVGLPFAKDLRHLPEMRKVLFCQNHFFAFRGMGDGEGWRDFDIREAFACSRVTARAVADCFGFDSVPVVRCVVDATLFQPRPKRLQVAFMPRKRPADAEMVRQFLIRLNPQARQVPWVAIDGRCERDVAAILGESAVFLALGRHEGLGLPPLEAMAAECAVAGWPACGGAEYATAENGFWAAEDDPLDCARALARAIDAAAAGGPALRRRLDAGRNTAAAYSEAGQRGDLAAFWGGIFDRG